MRCKPHIRSRCASLVWQVREVYGTLQERSSHLREQSSQLREHEAWPSKGLAGSAGLQDAGAECGVFEDGRLAEGAEMEGEVESGGETHMEMDSGGVAGTCSRVVGGGVVGGGVGDGSDST